MNPIELVERLALLLHQPVDVGAGHIRSLCPETVGEHDAGHRVYPGPGYVLVLRPQERLAVLAARRAP